MEADRMMVDSINFKLHFLIKLTPCVLIILSSFVSLEACIYPKREQYLECAYIMCIHRWRNRGSRGAFPPPPLPPKIQT